MSSAVTFLIAFTSAFKGLRRVRALAARNGALIFEMDSSIGIEIRRVSGNLQDSCPSLFD
jgi:hypothetical protein